MDERSLLTLLQKRPNEGMKELMRQYMGYCYYIVRNKLAEFPQEDIEDLEKGGFRVFLATLARRRAADCYRKKAENLPLHEEIQENPKEVSFEDREVLLQAIRSLGEPDEKILIWKFYYGYPTKTIASALGLKENTVDQKVRRGLEKLRKALEGGGFYEGCI